MNEEERYHFNIIEGFLDLWFEDLSYKRGKTDKDIRKLRKLLPSKDDKIKIIKKLLRFD